MKVEMKRYSKFDVKIQENIIILDLYDRLIQFVF